MSLLVKFVSNNSNNEYDYVIHNNKRCNYKHNCSKIMNGRGLCMRVHVLHIEL